MRLSKGILALKCNFLAPRGAITKIEIKLQLKFIENFRITRTRKNEFFSKEASIELQKISPPPDLHTREDSTKNIHHFVKNIYQVFRSSG